MRIYHQKADASENKRICHSCARNKHKQCDHHMNDQAFDAQDFIMVWCDCFCEGRIGREFDSLMEMAKHYADAAKTAQEETRTSKILAARAADTAEQALEAIRWFDDQARDDEGNLLDISRRNQVDSVLDEFLGRITRIAKSSSAVLEAIAEGRMHQQEDIIDQLFTPTPSQHLQRKSVDFDGPIGDGPQGHVELDPEVDDEGHTRQCSPSCTGDGHYIQQAVLHNERQRNVEPSRRRVIDPEAERQEYEQAEDFDAAGYSRRRALPKNIQREVDENLENTGWPVD
jgi:hypothetical protein